MAFLVVAAIIIPTPEGAASTSIESAAQKEEKEQLKEFEYKDTLGEYKKESKNKRHEIVVKFIEHKGLPKSAEEGFYNCLSQMVYSKSEKLTVREVLGWCYNDYSADPTSLTKRVNFDNFDNQFSGWDGSHRALEKFIKANMNDEGSYEHIKTGYRLVLDENPRAIVNTTFSGRNAYGAVVKQTVSAAVNIETGAILEILQ